MRVVFDTNVVVSALVFGGRLGWLRVAWGARTVTPVVCRETVAEVLRVLAYGKFRLTQAEQHVLLRDYLPAAETVRLPHPPPVLPMKCRDREDEVFLQLALASGADALCSGDADLLALREAAAVTIISPDELRPIIG